MLGKLLKHEFGATARYFIPLYGIILMLTPLIGLMMRAVIYLNMEDNMDLIMGEPARLGAIASFALMGILGYVFLVIAIFIATLVLIIIRFYRTMATSEAYLTFTLPVKTWQLVLSKTITATVWEVLAGITAIFSVAVVFLTSGFATLREMLKYCEDALGFFLYNMNDHDLLMLVLFLISTFTGCIACIMQIYCSIALAQLFRNHRVLISIGFYFAIYFVLQFIGLCLFFILPSFGLDSETLRELTYTLSIMESTATSIAGFCVTTQIMKRHLNV